MSVHIDTMNNSIQQNIYFIEINNFISSTKYNFFLCTYFLKEYKFLFDLKNYPMSFE